MFIISLPEEISFQLCCPVELHQAACLCHSHCCPTECLLLTLCITKGPLKHFTDKSSSFPSINLLECFQMRFPIHWWVKKPIEWAATDIDLKDELEKNQPQQMFAILVFLSPWNRNIQKGTHVPSPHFSTSTHKKTTLLLRSQEREHSYPHLQPVCRLPHSWPKKEASRC